MNVSKEQRTDRVESCKLNAESLPTGNLGLSKFPRCSEWRLLWTVTSF